MNTHLEIQFGKVLKGLQHNGRGRIAVSYMAQNARKMTELANTGSTFNDLKDMIEDSYQVGREQALVAGVDVSLLPKNVVGGQFT